MSKRAQANVEVSIKKTILLRIYMALIFLEGVFVVIALALLPADPKNAVLLGYSSSRLAMMGMALAVSLICGGFLGWAGISRPFLHKSISIVDHILENHPARAALTLLAALGLIGGVTVLLVPAAVWDNAVYRIERLRPMVIWETAIAAQTLMGYLLWRGKTIHWQNLTDWKPIFRAALITGGIFLVVGGLIIWSKIGLQPDLSGWYPPGTPILPVQVAFSFVIGMSLPFLKRSFEYRRYASKKGTLYVNQDLVLSILLWVTACIVWWNEPVRKWSYVTSQPTPPNFEFYPYSDAALYDGSAQRLLIGTSRDADVMLRPLYSFFLALLHIIGGQDYEWIVALQVMVLAVIPALAYLIGVKMAGRPAGIIAALLLILRERNSIALTDVIEVSHSKLLLSEAPALALMLLFILVLIMWLQERTHWNFRGVLTGAALGLVTLVRSHALLLIPAVLVILLLADHFAWGRVFRRFALFLTGLALVITPWVWRNYRVSERAAIENPEFYIRILASGYVHSEDEINSLPGETFDDYYARMNKQIAKFIFENPGEVAQFYISHFMHNEVSAVIYLPLSPKLHSLRSYLNALPFWYEPSSIPSTGQAVVLFLNLGVISVGMAVAFHRLKWIGLSPLLIHLGYSLSVVPLRLSGFRFIMPVDWVPLLYYSIGLTVLGAALISLFSDEGRGSLLFDKVIGDNTPDPAPPFGIGNDCRNFAYALFVSAVFGLSLPLIEMITPVKYPSLPQKEIVRQHVPAEMQLSNGNKLSSSDLVASIQDSGGLTILYGRALYPGYYRQGKYWGDANPRLLAASQFDRLQFELIGPSPAFVFIPLAKPPRFFPHASDVVVIGCTSTSGVRALVIQVEGQEEALTASPWNGLTCGTSP